MTWGLPVIIYIPPERYMVVRSVPAPGDVKIIAAVELPERKVEPTESEFDRAANKARRDNHDSARN